MLHTYVRHANEGEFQLATPGTFVRDLGVGDITDGELAAQVVRIEREGAYIEELHRHDDGFSLAYVLKGWLDGIRGDRGQHLGPGAPSSPPTTDPDTTARLRRRIRAPASGDAEVD